jgi:ATP-dependent Clp protease adaptor protein ClpS
MPAFASAAQAEPDVATPAEPVVVVKEAAPARRTKRDRKPKRQPRYHVVLWNDDDHTYEYVVVMLRMLFGHPPETGLRLAKEVDTQGRVVVLTTTLEHAELKRDQIHAFGADRLLARSKGSMSASIEPEA